MSIRLNLGALADPVAEQLYEQGYTIGDAVKEMRIQNAVNEANYLRIQGYLTDKEYDRVARRIMKDIGKLAKPVGGSKK